jgi:hypothetical protein
LAIITMQMMPKISWPQRVPSDARERVSTVVVAVISLPVVFVVVRGSRFFRWYTLYNPTGSTNAALFCSATISSSQSDARLRMRYQSHKAIAYVKHCHNRKIYRYAANDLTVFDVECIATIATTRPNVAPQSKRRLVVAALLGCLAEERDVGTAKRLKAPNEKGRETDALGLLFFCGAFRSAAA